MNLNKKTITETVYFLNNLTVEEELDIIDAQVKQIHLTQTETVKPIVKSCGNYLYNRDESLYDEQSFCSKGIDQEQSIISSVVTSVLFLPPFYNFVQYLMHTDKNFSENETFVKIFELMKYYQEKNVRLPQLKFPRIELAINSYSNDVNVIFNELLESLHMDLVRRYYYTENTWKDAIENIHKPKQIFNEYSPIVDLFQSKIKKNFYKKSTIETEYINFMEVDLCKIDFNKFIQSISPFEGKLSVLKHPHIMTFRLLNCNTTIPENIKIQSKTYKLKSLVCSEEDTYFSLVNNGGWIKLGERGETVGTINLDSQIELAFYVATDYDFEF
ncbi:hypothetical protein H312_01141, partial [Anncaliia algerae PRA339]